MSAEYASLKRRKEHKNKFGHDIQGLRNKAKEVLYRLEEMKDVVEKAPKLKLKTGNRAANEEIPTAAVQIANRIGYPVYFDIYELMEKM